MIVLAVDPGHRWIAVVTRDMAAVKDKSVLDHQVLDTKRMDAQDPETVIAAVLEEVRTQIRTSPLGVDLVAVEGVNGPTGFRDGKRAPLDPSTLITTAGVMGAVIGAFSALVVPPAGFGAVMPSRAALLAAYPRCLIGPRERTGGGKTISQHARAAWDVAGAASRQNRTNIRSTV